MNYLDYSPKVIEHFTNPRNMGEIKNPDGAGKVGNPVCGDLMLLTIKVGKKGGKEIIKDIKFKTFGCLPPDEEVVLNPSGWQKISKIFKKDKVYDSEGKSTFVVETYKRKYKGKLLKIIPFVSPYNSFEVTPNHPVLAIKRTWVVGSRKSSNCEWLRVSADKLVATEPKFINAGYLEKGDYLLYTFNKLIRNDKFFSKDFMRLLGYYLAEGYVTAENSVVNFALSVNEKKAIKEVKELIFKITRKKGNYRIRNGAIEIYVCSRKLARLLMYNGGKLAKHKKLHRDLLTIPFEKQWEMVETYIIGDGNVCRRRKNNTITYRINTVSKNLAIQLQQILSRGGIFASIRNFTRTNCQIEGRKLKDSLQYLVSFKLKRNHKFVHYVKDKNYFLVPIKKIESRDYSGNVYNFQVAFKPNTYLVRGFAVHNCAAAIATSSMITEMAKGKTLEEAAKITRANVADELEGLPPIKMHCSNLAADALRVAIEDYKKKKRGLE